MIVVCSGGQRIQMMIVMQVLLRSEMMVTAAVIE